MPDHPSLHSDLPALAVIAAFLERMLPGASPCMRRLRDQIIDFVTSPTSKAVLLRGDIGVGKSTIARLIALLRRVAFLPAAEASKQLEMVRFDGPNRIDVNLLASWYVELALTGLVENLAESQLFGSMKNAYTGAIERAGVFEQASTGRMPKGDVSIAAQLTGGVVFLDEVGDLPDALQAKLLPVLSGGVYFRLGSEGKRDAELQFRGVVITASWKPLDTGLVRPDLLSRIAGQIIHVPALDERMEDFDIVVDGIQDSLIAFMRSEIERMERLLPAEVLAYWRQRRANLRPLGPEARQCLSQVRWGDYGNLRGLTSAIEQILTAGRAADHVVAQLRSVREAMRSDSSHSESLLSRLLKRPRTGQGLAGHVRAIELEQRRELQRELHIDPDSFDRLANNLQIEQRKLAGQLRGLDRERNDQTRRGRQ